MIHGAPSAFGRWELLLRILQFVVNREFYFRNGERVAPKDVVRHDSLRLFGLEVGNEGVLRQNIGRALLVQRFGRGLGGGWFFYGFFCFCETDRRSAAEWQAGHQNKDELA